MNEVKEIKVMSINMMSRMTGDPTIAVGIGYRQLSAEPVKDVNRQKLDIHIPGFPHQKNETPVELIANIFFTEKEWEIAKDKFLVGQIVKLNITKNGVEISKV